MRHYNHQRISGITTTDMARDGDEAEGFSSDEEQFFDAIESHSTDLLAKDLARRLAQETVCHRH